MTQQLVELIGLRERIERSLVGVLPTRHRVTAVMTIGREFNQLLLLKTGSGTAVTPGGTPSHSPAAQGDAVPLPRPFHLVRLYDHSGVSGTGIVAEGVLFSTGRVALHWISNHPSTAAWDNVEQMLAIHGHGGDTVLRWLDEAVA